MENSRFVLAVDGGATKTTLVIYSDNGDTLFEKTSTGSNYHAIGANKVERVITDLLLDAYQAVPFERIDIAAFAMAGIDTKYDLSIVKAIIDNCFQNVPFETQTVIVENDVHSTLIGITSGNPGALILSGTGSIAYAIDRNGNIVRTGGWGHRAADEGSGYWIGQEIIRAVVQFEDGRTNKQTALKKLLYEKLQVDHMEEMLSWLYRPEYTNAQVASISSILCQAVSLRDETAIDIANRAASELSRLASTVLRKINVFEEPFTIYLNGGILQNHPYIRNVFIQEMLEAYPNLSFELCHKQPIEYIVNRAITELN
ncbi:N-acetylglucosamine kinase [Ureibacillus sp. MALMAid1270]|uniref:N-acetylglucosamine kinase n=1 Tax=Ureibacillus sp. MALMAid1270 TaxID=3411629 RepID=UPI003BA44121